MQTDFEKNSFHADAKRLGEITVDPRMESKLTSFLKKMTRGKSIVPPMVFMGTAGGAYYLYKQKDVEKGPTNHPSEDLTKSTMPGAQGLLLWARISPFVVMHFEIMTFDFHLTDFLEVGLLQV